MDMVIKRVECLEDLGPRRREVALLISEGLSRREIAERMFLSEATVRNHINQLVKSLGIKGNGRVGVKIARWVWEQKALTPALSLPGRGGIDDESHKKGEE